MKNQFTVSIRGLYATFTQKLRLFCSVYGKKLTAEDAEDAEGKTSREKLCALRALRG
jgi:hypothetical protein